MRKRSSKPKNGDRRSGDSTPAFLSFNAESWDHARDISMRMIRWAFRGQGDAEWGLTTTIERATSYLQNAPDVGFDLRAQREQWMMYNFRRRAHHYVQDLPAEKDLLEWLALIQHYGGPTRLLDFTYSFYIAAFFAMERAENDAAVWGINLEALEDIVASRLGLSGEKSTIETNHRHVAASIEFLKGTQPKRLILSLEPERLNQRLSIQQGLFLFPCDVASTFEENMAATFDSEPRSFFDDSEFWDNANDSTSITLEKASVVKIVIPRAFHRTALEDLKYMNITAETLFPGLDGFARSLYFHLRIPGLEDPEMYPD